MKTFHVMTAEGSRYQTEAWAVSCGEDLSVTICGGSRYHVGATALGCARPLYEGKPRRSATVSVLCAFEHKDDEVAKWGRPDTWLQNLTAGYPWQPEYILMRLRQRSSRS